jgi:hypothetical protein
MKEATEKTQKGKSETPAPARKRKTKPEPEPAYKAEVRKLVANYKAAVLTRLNKNIEAGNLTDELGTGLFMTCTDGPIDQLIAQVENVILHGGSTKA